MTEQRLQVILAADTDDANALKATSPCRHDWLVVTPSTYRAALADKTIARLSITDELARHPLYRTIMQFIAPRLED